jgi:hypothetical protein
MSALRNLLYVALLVDIVTLVEHAVPIQKAVAIVVIHATMMEVISALNQRAVDALQPMNSCD